MGRKTGVSIQTTIYQGFRGVDFSTDPSLVDKRRSPLATNMIADSGGMPEKRVGWRVLHRLQGEITNLWYGVFKGVTKYLAHAGDKIYIWDETEEAPQLLMEGLAEEKGAAVSLGGKLWILTGGEYLVYDGETLSRVSDNAYAPTSIIGRKPTGGGTSFESLNLLSRYRVNEFIPDGAAQDYQLDATELDAEGEVTATVWGEEMTEGNGFTVNRETGVVSFSTPPKASQAGAEGAVRIKFPKTPEDQENMIGKCRIMTTYGVGSSDRIFFAGNPDYPNRDWYSGLNDPTYVPDLNYSTVGIEATAIMGYLRLGDNLAVVKEDNGQDSTVFLRSGTLDESGKAIFSLRQSVAGVGAIGRGCFGMLLDDPLFLSGTGICAISTNVLTTERIVQNRSYYVNAALTGENGLDKAVAEQWKGMYVLAVNDHMYIMDGRQQKSYRSESLGDYVYECYYWDNVPANCLMSKPEGDDEFLYFGTKDGRICKFNSDIDTMARFSDDGQAIQAVWATKADDDGDASLLKTMIKKGNCVTLKPYARSSAEICFRTDRDAVDWRAVEASAEGKIDIFSWDDIDFTRFSFDSNDAPREIMFRTKVKKYKRLQILIRNNGLNEGFGIFGIVKHYVVGNFAKQ